MSLRLLLDLTDAPQELDLSRLSGEWRDVSEEYPEFSEVPDAAMVEFDGTLLDLMHGRRDLSRYLGSGGVQEMLISNDFDGGFTRSRLQEMVETRARRPAAPSNEGPAEDAGGGVEGSAGADNEAEHPGDDDERALIDSLSGEQKADFAAKLLEVRLDLQRQEVRKAREQARIVKAEAKFERERAAHARATAEGVRERVNHMREWRRIAKWGIGFFVATTIFAMWATWYLLTGPVHDGKMTGETASLLIFVLALFAASPAALLLLERPLRGIDSWAPGGRAEESGGERREGEAGRGAARGSADTGRPGTDGDEAEAPAKST